MKKLNLLLLFSILALGANAQDLIWWNPVEHEFPVIEGQAWGAEVKRSYQRLPKRSEHVVPPSVWSNGTNSAGLMIRFRSNSPSIHIRYNTFDPNGQSLNHMPATGVSGVDLYTISSDGEELWCAARRSFGDTILYKYDGLKPNDQYHEFGREYRLYLPLYNEVKDLEIGVVAETYFEPLPIKIEKPIVVYGTSITHGACASRPGMAWANILSRKMDRQLINLGFSGSGRLDESVINLLTEIDAKVLILDCLPNLIGSQYTTEILSEKIRFAVKTLKAKRPETPILLVEHAGYTDGLTAPKRAESYQRVNKIQRDVFGELIEEGVKELYYLSKEEIGLSIDAMVDGTHPSDLGMQQYADAYETSLRTILKEPLGGISTQKPITQFREPGNYDWQKRHRQILELNNTDPPKAVILANSIIHFWGGEPKAKIAREQESWETYFSPAGLRNLAYGWDRIENVLWRVYHGELDGFDAEKVLMMIGTNNLHLNTNEEVIEGLRQLSIAIKERQPKAQFTLLGILPRRDLEQRVIELNTGISQLAKEFNLSYRDLGGVFLLKDGKIDETLFSDGLHPNATGYLKLRPGIQSILER
ncbi:MAG: lysophospholipase L1-like esterase [Arcticibacterium sp.]|jgi:lysophospholipase L1-like esterase